MKKTLLLRHVFLISSLVLSSPLWAENAAVPQPLLTSANLQSTDIAKTSTDIQATVDTTGNTTDAQLSNQDDTATSDNSDEHVIWRKQPLNVVLPVNREKLVSFPEPVELINTNPELTGDKLSVMINAGTIYLTAHQTFSPMRVSVRLKNSGQLVLLDLSAAIQADDTAVDVVITDKSKTTQSNPSEAAFQTTDIDLLRFAITTFYAPARLVMQPDGITRTAMYTQKNVTLFYDETTLDYPLASWRDSNHFVTAVTIQNIQKTARTLDPRHLHGNWLAVTFYPTNHLKSQGQVGDSTTLFLISALPFNLALTTLQGAQG